MKNFGMENEKSKYFQKIVIDENQVIVDKYRKSKLIRKSQSKDCNVPICSICLEYCKEQCHPNLCLHWFCYNCILEWGKLKPICPLCKVEFNSVSNKEDKILQTFEKKESNEDSDYVSDYEEGEENEDFENEDELGYIENRIRTYGYELDGFVVADDEDIEFDQNDEIDDF